VVLLVAGILAGASSDEDNTDTADRPEATVTPPGNEPAGQDTPSTTGAETEQSDGVPDAARSYFEAFATMDLSRVGAMLDNSVEDFPAGLYAVHQIANIRAIGTPLGTSMTVGDDTIVFKSTTGYAPDGAEQTETLTYGNFAVQGDKLTGFNVNDTPVADSIRAGGDPVTADGVTVRIVTAYHTARGDLFLNVDMTNGRQGVLNVSSYEWAPVTLHLVVAANADLGAGVGLRVDSWRRHHPCGCRGTLRRWPAGGCDPEQPCRPADAADRARRAAGHRGRGRSRRSPRSVGWIGVLWPWFSYRGRVKPERSRLATWRWMASSCQRSAVCRSTVPWEVTRASPAWAGSNSRSRPAST
jgi:hypothetical protein